MIKQKTVPWRHVSSDRCLSSQARIGQSCPSTLCHDKTLLITNYLQEEICKTSLTIILKNKSSEVRSYFNFLDWNVMFPTYVSHVKKCMLALL